MPDHADLVQEAYARLLRGEGSRHLASAKGFLFTIARNVAIDMLRRQRAITHEPISDATNLPVLEENPGVTDALESRQRHAVLIEAIAALPDRCREVFELSRVHGLKYAEIARTLGISVKTVEAQMGKALRTLRERLAAWLPEESG